MAIDQMGRMAAGTVTAEQWFEVRETFEVPAAGLAARRRTDAHLAELGETLFDPDSAGLDVILPAHHQVDAHHRAIQRAVTAGDARRPAERPGPTWST